MHFVDPAFLFYFLPVVLILHAILIGIRKGTSYPNSAKLFIFFATLLFYGYHQSWWAALLVLSLVLDYLWAQLIQRSKLKAVRRLFLWLSIAQNLFIFALFKYVPSVVEFFEAYFPNLSPLVPQVFENGNVPVLPAGLSFYLLESASFVFDVYRREVVPPKNVLNFFAFVGAFPRLIAGPIVRYSQINEQFGKFRGIDIEKGLGLFIGGLFLKVCFGDHFGIFTQYAFNQGPTLDLISAWIGVVSFAMQLYFDFLGYSTMAIGLGFCLGFEYPPNFDSPYISRSITEFWRRWHITLGAWVRDYLFFPLALTLRRRSAGTFVSIMLSFFLLGLWHGPTFNMVAMGLWWGFWIWFEWRIVKERLPRALSHLLTLTVVLIGWVLFHSKSQYEAWQIIKAMFLPPYQVHRFNPEAFGTNPMASFFCILGFIYCFWIEPAKLLKQEFRVWVRVPALIAGLVIAVLCAFSARLVPFLYFRF